VPYGAYGSRRTLLYRTDRQTDKTRNAAGYDGHETNIPAAMSVTGTATDLG